MCGNKPAHQDYKDKNKVEMMTDELRIVQNILEFEQPMIQLCN